MVGEPIREYVDNHQRGILQIIHVIIKSRSCLSEVLRLKDLLALSICTGKVPEVHFLQRLLKVFVGQQPELQLPCIELQVGIIRTVGKYPEGSKTRHGDPAVF